MRADESANRPAEAVEAHPDGDLEAEEEEERELGVVFTEPKGGSEEGRERMREKSEYEAEYRVVFENGLLKRKKLPAKLFKPKRKKKVWDEEGEVIDITVSRDSDLLDLDIIGEEGEEEALMHYRDRKQT